MNYQGIVTIHGEEKLAKFIAVLVENSTALFKVEPADNGYYNIIFDGGY